MSISFPESSSLDLIQPAINTNDGSSHHQPDGFPHAFLEPAMDMNSTQTKCTTEYSHYLKNERQTL
ncbi:uncharacterized protein BO96DRAFT_438371 [Aspergillus niger CBS 101883]|uniref:Uncharacterized protein n=2 Tax=Aspergillus niger TaxID=5061 RepID=A2QA88_ASPNC|nr:uncharacterized protein BO96DRAFT_438371 [Aspergillus niger CBS 101883]XP_059599766.1 hypothetical protein An01g10590 [Aspergillus niger]PYH52087.1 hypothetical protein BO96DRAFT_438371 [Aspergillus niger CBS 101883]CAK37240.1 hypothetical protein An01g10590 [Aspergillus niger]